ncbi:MAG: rhamnogalacturonan acetylesterase [Pirellulales bacterium]
MILLRVPFRRLIPRTALVAAVFAGVPCVAEPLSLSVVVPEGNYRVTVKLGSANEAASTTVKAENRRLMLENVKTAPGEFATRSCLVNVHTPKISPERRVRLKPREIGILRWDDKLTLEFSGSQPAVCSVDIEPVDDAVTIYIAGDSTVTDQAEVPWAGWGQMLPRFFQSDRVVVSNHAESGETLSSFRGERRMEKLLTTLRAGDFLFIQFGHNDMKQIGPDAGAFKNYTRLLKEYIATARQHGATPVLVTPMNRLSFDASGKISDSLGDYPEAMRRVAAEEQVALVDLNAKSRDLYQAWGPEKTRSMFVDETHSNEGGAYEFARFIAEEIKRSDLEIARDVVDEMPQAGPPSSPADR